MRAEYVNPFLKSTIETFKTMVGLKVKPGKIFLLKDSQLVADIFGVIEISGNLEGSVAMAYPRDTAIKISSKFLGEDIRELNASVIDCVGELSNIVTGFAKKDLQDLRVVISLPKVFQNRDDVVIPKNAPVVCIPFDSELGSFVIEVSYS
jgi:chemotaxis protein CheX